MTALNQQPPSSHHRSRQLFFQLLPGVVMQFLSNSNLDHEVLVVGYCTDAARIVGSIQEGLQQEVSVLLQFRYARESTSARLAQLKMKFHKAANPVLILGVLLQVRRAEKKNELV